MFKWPWSAQVDTTVAALPWQQALVQPIFSMLSADEQQALTALAHRILQQKKISLLQGLQFEQLQLARLALLFCLPVLKLGQE